MIEKILKSKPFLSSFNIEFEKQKYVSLGGILPPMFDDLNEINKTFVISLIRNKSHTKKEEILGILFWGIYFKVLSRSPKTLKSLILFISNDDFEAFMERAILVIINSDSPKELFRMFTRDFKIPGLEYAYFTKIFFFYREALVPEKQTFPILDKWLSNAWCAIDGLTNNNTDVYDKFYKAKTDYFFDGTLKRKKPEAYECYIQFMSNLAKDNKINLITLEEKLFGADRTKNPKNNPRNLYRSWAKQNNIPLKKGKTESNGNENNKVNQMPIEISGPFYLGKTETYFPLRIKSEKSKKVGFITKKGCLHVQEGLKTLLEPYDLEWLDDSKSSYPENSKYHFKDLNDCKEFLKNRKLLIE